MRILMVNNSLRLRGGSERVMFDEAKCLQAAGHEVAFFGPLSSEDRLDIPFAQFMPRMADYNETSPLKRLEIARNVVYNSASGRLFEQLVTKFRPEIVHGHNIYAGPSTAVLDVCERRRLPAVITLHDYKLVCPSYRMLRDGKPCALCLGGKYYHCVKTRCHKNSLAVSATSTIEAYFNQFTHKYLKASYLLAPSQFLLSTMERGGIPTDKLRLLPNGVSLSDVASTFDARENFILYAGRLSEEKGILTLLDAVENSDLQLRVAGDGPLRPLIEAELKRRNMTNVQLDGHLSATQMQVLLCTARAVVVPSEWYENASMIVLEAMAHGTPVICSDIGGLPEQVQDGISGLIFQPGNASDLKDKLGRLASDSSLGPRLGLSARARVAERFTLNHHVALLQEIYEEAIREAGSLNAAR